MKVIKQLRLSTFTALLFFSIIGILESITPALTAPVNGEFSIRTRRGNLVDVYGDNFKPVGDKSPATVHLWNQKTKSNTYVFGADENSGNEIQLAADRNICLTPQWPLGSRPNDGTPVVAIRDCANAFNWKKVGDQLVIGRFPTACLDIALGKDVQWSKMQVVTCRANNPAQQFLLAQPTDGGGGNPPPDNGSYIKPVGCYVSQRPGGSYSHKRFAAYDFGCGWSRPDTVAVRGGEIIFAGFKDNMYGNVVMIRHSDGRQTWYLHLTSWAVSKGQRVNQGQKIGNVGNSGNALDGTHLHLEFQNANGTQDWSTANARGW
jgi:murein DD-endopeptidase MepM/ murein hydrolase activator NlpD